jgi:hypothetical protein
LLIIENYLKWITMSLIVTYIGSKGCIIAGDKRRIGFYGSPEAREILEEELYSGNIKTEEELIKKAEKQGINLKISDDISKIHEMGDVLVGEVISRATHETKRKRIYAISGAYSMVELTGSNIDTVKSGGRSIIVYGNKYTQELAEETIKKYWKPKMKFVDVERIIEAVMNEVAKETPSVSDSFDLITKYKSLDQKDAKEVIRTAVLEDVKALEAFRNQLREDNIKATKNIQMASKIIIEGNIGTVTQVNGNEIEIILDKTVEALDFNWEPIAKPSERVNMSVENPQNVVMGDLIVIEKENLCIKRTKESLNCGFILCRSDD